MNICGECKTKIINSKCACGWWLNRGEEPNAIKTIECAIRAYDYLCEQHQTTDPLSGDHYSGNCFVFFKGDYEDCEKAKEFNIKMRNDKKSIS